jgi:hypothetical protein
MDLAIIIFDIYHHDYYDLAIVAKENIVKSRVN